MDPKLDAAVRWAISGRFLLRFKFGGLSRIVEPHLYGKCGGLVRILAYQTAGESNRGGLPEWRLFPIDGISEPAVLNESSFRPRENFDRGFHFEEVFLGVPQNDSKSNEH